MNFLEKAQSINIKIFEKEVSPEAVCRICKGEQYHMGYGTERIKKYDGSDIVTDKEICYDLGEHFTGYLSFDIKGHNAISDSPVKLKLTFAEIPFGFSYEDSKKEGWLSYSWLQEEYVFIDDVPSRVTLPRRYAARYIRIEIVAKNKKMDVEFSNVCFKAVSSAGFDYVPTVKNEKWKKTEEVCVRTLRECMQSFYEDSPMRDRRLWLGDLRLHARVNYCTYDDLYLIKKCLYLFAGLTDEYERIHACVYEKPQPINGETYLYDFALLYMAALSDYYDHTGDVEAARELFDIAYKQFEIFYDIVDDKGLVKKKSGWWCFIDWNWDEEDKPKSLPMAAIGAYCLTYAEKLAKNLSKEKEAAEAQNMRQKLCDYAKSHFYNSKTGLFEEEGITMWVANIFMILSDSLSRDEEIAILDALEKSSDAITPVTPYNHHYVLEAYEKTGLFDKMAEYIDSYWGQMIENGADTFWEAYDKDDPLFSPYDDCLLNSYCHAFSCTPIYFIKKYLDR